MIIISFLSKIFLKGAQKTFPKCDWKIEIERSESHIFYPQEEFLFSQANFFPNIPEAPHFIGNLNWKEYGNNPHFISRELKIHQNQFLSRVRESWFYFQHKKNIKGAQNKMQFLNFFLEEKKFPSFIRFVTASHGSLNFRLTRFSTKSFTIILWPLWRSFSNPCLKT